MDKRYQVFVSSTYNDLIEERKEATQAILKCNCFPAGMELFPASNKKQWNVIKQVIDDSDFYLLILAGRYGSLGIDDTGKKIGYTEMEFDYALLQGKPIIVMLHRCPESLPAKLTEKTEANIKRLEKFRKKAMSGRLVAFWENKDQLNGEILISLHKMMASTPEAVGWIKADTMSNLDEVKKTDMSKLVEEFKIIDNPEDKIDYLEEIQYTSLSECFRNKKFIKEFADLINASQPSTVICSAISLIPYSLEPKTKKHLMNDLDIKRLFLSQCIDGKIQDSELSNRIIQLLDKLKEYSLDYSEPMLNCLKEGTYSSEQKNTLINYIENCGLYTMHRDEGKKLLQYVTHEFGNEQRILSTKDLASLLTTVCKDGDSYVNIYNIFINANRDVQKDIIYSIFEHHGSDTFIINPNVQKMFFKMCEIVYSWNEDDISADLLLYCLFVRSYDIFTVDEIFSMLDEFNDDVFYLFFWHLGYGEFGMGTDEVYDLDNKEKLRATEIIKNRKHPREKKLLENLNQ